MTDAVSNNATKTMKYHVRSENFCRKQNLSNEIWFGQIKGRVMAGSMLISDFLVNDILLKLSVLIMADR